MRSCRNSKGFHVVYQIIMVYNRAGRIELVVVALSCGPAVSAVLSAGGCRRRADGRADGEMTLRRCDSLPTANFADV